MRVFRVHRPTVALALCAAFITSSLSFAHRVAPVAANKTSEQRNITLATLHQPDAATAPQDGFVKRFADFPKSTRADFVWPDQPPVITWPSRLGTLPAGDNGAPIMGQITEVTSPARLRGGMRGFDLPDMSLSTLRELAKEDRTSGYADAAVLADRANLDAESFITFPGSGSWSYSIPKVSPGAKLKRSERNNANITLRYTSLLQNNPTSASLDTTWFYYYEPDKSVKSKGLAILMPGLLGTPEGPLGQLTTKLMADGWGVLRLVAQPARFVENVEFTISPQSSAQQAVAALAELAAQRSAECAYAVQAASAFIEAKYPELKQTQRAIIGCSGGALTLPTVVAREPDRYRSCVLIGGGANFFLMTLKTNYKHVTNVRYTFTSPADDARITELSQAYLTLSPLDSYFTVSALHNKRVWYLNGGADYAVPTPLADLLWERLGKPKRIVMEGASHELLFAQLSGYIDEIVSFVGDETPK